MSAKIIVIDEDVYFAKGLKYSLEQDDCTTEMAFSMKEAMERFNKIQYDLVLLNLNLSDGDGLALCQNIRNMSTVPIIILMEKKEDINKILALEYGADDYIAKPFNILILKAKIKAILRRARMKTHEIGEQIIKIGDYTINALGRKLISGKKSVHLTGKEFDLLYLLASNPGKVFTREELLQTIWGYEYFGDLRTVDVHIRRLREKIEKNCTNVEYIHTRWGVGYYFKGKETSAATD